MSETVNPYGNSTDPARQCWQTPPEVWDFIERAWRPVVDGAASNDAHLLNRWWGPGSIVREDALDSRPWCQSAPCDGPIFFNPPFKLAAEFVKRAIKAQAEGDMPSVFLMKFCPAEKWWGDVDAHASRVIMLAPRVAYVAPLDCPDTSPPFASAIVEFPLARIGGVVYQRHVWREFGRRAQKDRKA